VTKVRLPAGLADGQPVAWRPAVCGAPALCGGLSSSNSDTTPTSHIDMAARAYAAVAGVSSALSA
jgi:hypothetical protein